MIGRLRGNQAVQSGMDTWRTAEATRQAMSGVASSADSGRPPTNAARQPAIQVFTLGAFRLLVRGRPVEDQAWRRKPARQLFKILLSRPSRRMTRDEAIDLL